ncbi:MAG: zinc-binding dehydrogenase [Planctomycetes bacterium]|nr:zinc-binding dehydrogenase [Planctomycetota bacterium]
MKATLIRRHGEIDVVEVGPMPAPITAPGEVVLEGRAAALNHLDIWVRKGGRAKLSFPHILGSDAAGVVAEVGQGAANVKVGDEVVVVPGLSCGSCEACRRGEQSECASFGIIGLSRPGVFAEKAAVPAANLLPKPKGLTWEETAALGIAYGTAWRMLFTRARLRPGETLLIHGIGGGVAIAALQFARHAGAEAIVTSSSDEKLQRARELGAAHGINYRTASVAEAVREITGGRGVDVSVNAVGAAAWATDFAAVRKGGRIVLCGVTTGAEAPTDLRALYWNQLNVLGSTFASHEDFRLMLQTVEDAGLRPVIDSVLPLAQASEAMARMERGEQFGKIILRT